MVLSNSSQMIVSGRHEFGIEIRFALSDKFLTTMSTKPEDSLQKI